MEETMTTEEDIEPQLMFVVHTRLMEYIVRVNKHSISLSSINSLDQISLTISQTIFWLSSNSSIVAFGLKLGDEIVYYYGQHDDLTKFRDFIVCRISFGSFGSDYLIGDIIGKGTFSEVHKVTNLRDGKDYALKKVKLRNKEHLKQLILEVQILHKLNHNGIIKLYEVYRLNDDTYGLITELVIGSSLESVINKQKQLKSKLEERDIQRILQQTLQILEYLHQNHIIHRDLKPQHILLCSNKEIKLIDFGLSCDDFEVKNTQVGTPGYMPPESFVDISCSQKGDIFSLGVVFYRLLNKGVSCFDALTLETVICKNRRCSIEFQITGYSEQAVHLLRQMLHKDPFSRITSTDALKHAYFSISRESPNLREEKGLIEVYKCYPRPSHQSRQR